MKTKLSVSLKHTLIAQYLICALLPLIIVSLFLIANFRSIQIDEQIVKQQALTDSVMLATQFDIEKASQNLLQISRDTNVALAGQSGLFGYSAASALNEYLSDFEFVAMGILVDKNNNLIEASPVQALLLETLHFENLAELSNLEASFEPRVAFFEDQALAETLMNFSGPNRRLASNSAGIIVLNAPLYLSEAETLDSRSTFTGRVIALILLDDLRNLISQRSTSLTLESLSIDGFSNALSDNPRPNDALTTSTAIKMPFSDLTIQATFYVSQSNALAAVDKLTGEYSFYAAIIVLVFFLIGSLFIRAELQPLDTLNQIVRRFRKGDLTTYDHQFRFSEFQSVAKLLSEMADNISEHQNSLEDKVAARTKALENALTEVKKINRELIRTQDQLIESEKMSQIGVLVAGVAHEVNTPIGVCVTAASILEDRVQVLGDAYDSNELSRSVFTDFIANANSCIDILLKNTERAADLIHSFKLVSVDQSSEQRREIVIKDYVELTIRSLQKELDRRDVSVNLSGDLGYTIETYPGAISQILSNLVLNSLKHGFKQQQTLPRQIDIQFEITQNSELDITFKDNGQGVLAENLPKLFEPFYTTGRQSGGSGLGLSIVYNLATQRLGGTINCYCEPNSGLNVFIEFPVTIIATQKP